MKSIEIDSNERQKAEDLARKFLIPFYDELTDAGKFVFIVVLTRDRGDEMTRIAKKFK